MKRILLSFFCSIGLALAAQAKLKVVATLPDLAALAHEVGADKIDVSAMASAVASIRGPSRLAGRRHQATMPLTA